MIHRLKSLAYRVNNVRLPDESLADFVGRLWNLLQRRRAASRGGMGKDELRAAARILRSGRLAYGPENRAFEAEFAGIYGAAGAAASSSGTAAVHVALSMCGVGPGDEVIVPPLTDMGSVLPILARNAIPIFVDVHPESWNLDPDAVESAMTPKTRAIIAVHLFGNPCDLGRLREIAERHDALLIEDCAQAHWSRYQDQPVGTIGDAGSFSLQWTKQITSGEGGVTISKHEDFAVEGRLFVDKGWNREGVAGPRAYPTFGVNYRLSELQAAVARAQLQHGEERVRRRSENARLVIDVVSEVPGIRFQSVADGCTHSYWQLGFTTDPDAALTADAVVQILNRRRIPCSAHYIGRPIHLCHEPLLEGRLYERSPLPFSLSDRGDDLDYGAMETPVAQSVLDRLVILPTPSEHLATRDVRVLAEEIKGALLQATRPARMQSKPRARYSLGVVGCGLIAREHLEAVREIPDLRIAAIADVQDVALRTVSSGFGVEADYADYEEMFAREALDIVLVSVWPKLHAAITVAAAKAGAKAVLCEKPIASNLGEAREMIEACTAAGTRLVIGHQHRFNPHIELARELLAKGEIGAIRRVSAHCSSFLINNGSHLIDTLLYLMGQPRIESVSGEIDLVPGLENRDQRVEKNSRASIALEGGTTATIQMGEDEKRPIAWHFEGENGSLDVGMESVVVNANGRTQTHRRVRVRSMQDQMSELIACLDDPSRTHRGAGEQGYVALEALIGILESARRGERVAMPVAQMAYPLDELPT